MRRGGDGCLTTATLVTVKPGDRGRVNVTVVGKGGNGGIVTFCGIIDILGGLIGCNGILATV